MYREDYRDEIDRDLESRYRDIRDPYFDDRARNRPYDYESRDRGLRSALPPPPPPPSLLDDPYYRRFESLERGSSLRDPLPLTPLPEVVEPGAEVIGTAILIPASPFEPRPKHRDKPINCDTVFVGSLPDNCKEKHLQDIFGKCGKISDVRISRGRNFGHVQYSHDDAVDRAIELSGCRIRVGPTNSLADVGKIHVDFAAPKGDPELQKRIHDSEMLTFTAQNASTISADLHREDAFSYAAKNVVHWIERGSCTPTTSNTFFGLISSINTHTRKLAKNTKTKEDEFAAFARKTKEEFGKMEKECSLLEEVFDVACTQKAWDHFTKPQRKTITQWKEFAADIRTQVAQTQHSISTGPLMSGEPYIMPPAKKLKTTDSQLEADLERAEKEIEQLKTDHEISLEKRDKQILQLKTLLARFKQSCPEEWEKAIGGQKEKAESKDKKGKKEQPLPPGEEAAADDEAGEQKPGEMIDGVDVGDLNDALETGMDVENSLAAAAAAYAQMRSVVGASETPAGLGMTEAEVAIVTVIATFLTVHPLGAAIGEIVSYLQAFNPASNEIYTESLLRRLPQVFQLSQSPEGSAKWWFLGFQTCCNSAQYGVRDSQAANNTEV